MSAPERADERFTLGLIDDVFAALEKAGYQCTRDADRGRAVELLGQLARAYDGGDTR